ncbi:FAD-dependent oxidoreductase [Massilia sp. NR 4-1]|uniref:FAD-dependent oxidoreductase n=1 Tax=Massilia sp. NR 4-1 TaxID=1678028 RepID=UPI00067CA01E|nr:FAD-dependent oxidoreductase [Massilia sp. NR 4-1]AKU21515.1 oxidoreductase [Massilia sp. NR 4-1]
MQGIGSSTSLWTATAPAPPFAPLAGQAQTDVCVIGAGIAGLTAAYLLLREGKQVIVIDAEDVGAGETGRTTAHFFPPDERYCEIQRRFGGHAAQQVADSCRSAIALVEAIVQREKIACAWQRLDGYLVAAAATHLALIEREYQAARQLDLEVEQLPRVPGLRQWDTGPCLRFAGQAQFHPLRYLNGLADAILRLGGRIHGATRAHDISGDSVWQSVATAQGEIGARAVVVATNTPFNDRLVMHTKLAAYRSHVLGLRVPRHQLPSMLLWDTGQPYYYVRLAGDASDTAYDVLIVGGQDHKVGQDARGEARYDAIEAWARLRFPMVREVVWRWSGTVMEPADGLPYLGHNPMDGKNVFIITGDSGNGMTYCTAGAMLVTDLIMERANPWAGLYEPARTPLHGLGGLLLEQANTMAQYADWARQGQVESADQIAPGQGALLRDGVRLLAVHRTRQGGLLALSAACPHMGCAVHWNGQEQSWDCPCHGSRFGVDGKVLHGPAAAGLAPAALPSTP